MVTEFTIGLLVGKVGKFARCDMMSMVVCCASLAGSGLLMSGGSQLILHSLVGQQAGTYCRGIAVYYVLPPPHAR